MGSSMVPFDKPMVVSYRLFIVTIVLSLTNWPRFAVECLRRSKQHGERHFGAKFELVDRCKPNFNTICERDERNRVDTLCRLSTMHERDRQTATTER